MGATYTRQSSYSDGDVITAAHTNDEFNQLLAAFAASSGHTHDGTAAEGGPITKLLGTSLTFGDGTADTDITVTFDGESNDGVLKWMEDEDYFEFSDDILVASTEKLQFRDTAIFINSSTDGQLDLIADGAVLIDTAGDITLDADGGDVVLKDGGTQYGSLTNTSGNLIIKSGSTTAVTFSGANTTFAGTVTIGSAEISETELEILDGATVTTAELNILDGVTATATEINIIDGDTSATSTTLADADRVVVNDAGTMKQVALTDFETYFESALDTLSNVTTVGALNSGSITSGFGNIDTGSSTITTTGLITGGSLDIDDVVINGSNIGHTDDTDLITVANGVVTVAGEISVTTLDIGGTNVTSTAAELNILDGVTATATELNIMDGDTSASSTTLADADRVVVNDAGTMKQVALTDFETYFESALDTLSNVTTVGALNSGSITSGFGAIDNGSSAITTTGTVTYGSLSDGSITITAFVDEDDMTSNSATLVPTQQSVKAYVDAQITAEDLDFQADSGGALSIDLDSETLTFTGGTGIDTSGSGNAVTFAIDSTVATLSGTQTLTNKTLTSPKINEDVALTATATELNLLDGVSGLVQADFTKLAAVDATAAELNLTDGSSAGTIVNSKAVIYGSSGEVNATTLQIGGTSITASAADINLIDGITNGTVIASKAIITDSNKDISGGRNITISGELDAATLDISGDADIDGTLEADAITVNGTALNTVIANEATALAIALG